MAAYEQITDKDRLRDYLLAYPQMNLYHIGDLDDFFWPHTQWTAHLDGETIAALTLMYTGERPPVLLGILNENRAAMAALLRYLLPSLPDAVYTHLSPGLETLFQPHYTLRDHGEHYKMGLEDLKALHRQDTSGVILLSEADLPRLEALYDTAYPGNWFNPRMLQTGQYAGISDTDGRLLCAAGVHVYSPQYKVAALGNITTLPEQRGRGLATKATAGLCKQLLKSVDFVGLNVRTDNLAAIRVYKRVGFEIAGVYHEWMMERNEK